MPRRAFRLAYDGRAYRGFQRQPDVNTVERQLFEAFDDRLDVRVTHEQPPPGYTAASRTDAGVSARGQTVAVDVPDWLDIAALNGALPTPIRTWHASDVNDNFHARHDAVKRDYAYFWYVSDPEKFSVDRGRTACRRLSGTHNFHNLTADPGPARRDLNVRLHEEPPFVAFRFGAGGFPRQLVRRSVSLLVDVATGRRSVDQVDRTLEPEPLPGSDGIAPAPPEPLVLLDVRYPQFSEADEAATALFNDRLIAALTQARVFRAIRDGGSDRCR